MGIGYVAAVGHQLIRCSFQGSPNTVRGPLAMACLKKVPPFRPRLASSVLKRKKFPFCLY